MPFVLLLYLCTSCEFQHSNISQYVCDKYREFDNHHDWADILTNHLEPCASHQIDLPEDHSAHRLQQTPGLINQKASIAQETSGCLAARRETRPCLHLGTSPYQ